MRSGDRIDLGASHYRRSEEPYEAARFGVDIFVVAYEQEFVVGLFVTKPDLIFRRATDSDPRLDNEPPDIHSDGVQFYIKEDGWHGYVLVPDPDSKAVRVIPVAGTAADTARVSAVWNRTPDGYVMRIQFNLGTYVRKGDRIPFNVVVNQMTPGRQRRAGQLALSGGGGWVYLRGDREPPESAVMLEVG